MERKEIEIEDPYKLFCYTLSVLVNDDDEVVFVDLHERNFKGFIGGYSGFTIGYGIMNPELKLPEDLDKGKFPEGSCVGYSSYSYNPMTSDSEKTRYRNIRYVAYDETGEKLYSQDFMFGNCNHVTEMGKKETYNMDALKQLIGKKFDDVKFIVKNGLFYNAANSFRDEEVSSKSK